MSAMPPELGCQSGMDGDLEWTWYRLERATEVGLLRDPRVYAAVREERIALASLNELEPGRGKRVA